MRDFRQVKDQFHLPRLRQIKRIPHQPFLILQLDQVDRSAFARVGWSKESFTSYGYLTVFLSCTYNCLHVGTHFLGGVSKTKSPSLWLGIVAS